MKDNSHAAVLVMEEEDPAPLDTFSSSGDTKDKKKELFLVAGTNWIVTVGAIQDKLFRSISFHALKQACGGEWHHHQRGVAGGPD